ncbi:expressed unknown protein [Seminavis robusta]|uniref:Rad60/SUMO-like domain-containing protein n=1 Tax=Seminavis robusta TaxID=568900 RepID=A0A9N8DPB6_9STRA|nr:expressed unknown protein [Seminavis robusta]|eukprot:Sro274_g105450.1 n/a (272) ;mRNA; f:42691-43506
MTSLLNGGGGDKTFEVPVGLKDRLVRDGKMTPDVAEKAITAYKQFIFLKQRTKDWDATIVSPSGSVDIVWHEHILDVKHYVKACNEYCGRLIGHNPDGGLNVAARGDRVKHTKLLLQAIFGDDHDTAVWSFGDEEDAAPRDKKKRRTDQHEVVDLVDFFDDTEKVNAGPRATEIFLTVESFFDHRKRRDPYREQLVVCIREDQPFEVLTSRGGPFRRSPSEKFSLRFDGERLDWASTPSAEGMKDGDTVTVFVTRKKILATRKRILATKGD